MSDVRVALVTGAARSLGAAIGDRPAVGGGSVLRVELQPAHGGLELAQRAAKRMPDWTARQGRPVGA